MRIERKGITRIVFVLERVVIKIPNFSCQWDHFLKGLIANITEDRTWKWNSGKYEEGKSHLICPVLWCSWGGWVLIMRKVDRCLSDEEYDKYDISEYRKHFGGDDKVCNYGMLHNRLVKIDYGQI